MDMDIEQIKELVRLMVDNDLAELDITEGDSKVRLRRGVGGEVAATARPAGAAVPAEVPAPVGETPPAQPAAEENVVAIKSPMVGTFYAAESPDAEPYVSVGSQVGPDTVVCIVEAMKVMNEIKAECSGQVVEICAENGQPVEYGQVLFRVKVS